jgi:adenosylhomocysteine nucleosidase
MRAAQTTDALAAEMEGAAVAQVCHHFDIAVAAVRTVSNRAADTAHVDFKCFTDDVAAQYAQRIADGFLRALARS